ncbi:cytochrome P450 [Salinisphaera sp. Q1T1-3]|uniref:cytochrome P450 n=1 Tax=Salinisphaera sp. Q1T1-3 TaxID=2321229 RepID=UPI00131474C7|nr:cytochrome P450 [Salinisphaera sp. Q1T1-3]
MSRPPGPAEPFPIAPDDATRDALAGWQRRYGDVFCVPDMRGGMPHWVVNEPALVQQVLVRQAGSYTKGMGLDRVKILLGNGIMVSEGDFWARQRRLMQPAFRPTRLADFNAMIFDENMALAERWTEAATAGHSVEAEAATSELTLIIVLKSIFGADYEQLVAAGRDPFALLTEESTRDLKFAARFRGLRPVVNDLIERRLAEPKTDFDFLGYLLAARTRDGESMSRAALIDEVLTLIVAGHETTASALAFAWYLIASHPTVRDRLQAEADATDLTRLRETGGVARDTLAYTDHVIAEVLRLYPPGWLLSRRATRTHELAGRPVAAGTQVFICPWMLHRHPAQWPDPNRFDPDRFAATDTNRHRLAYIPFAAGPRHCVGEHMAATEMRVHLATLLSRFTPEWRGRTTPRLESAINLRPADGIPLQLSSR